MKAKTRFLKMFSQLPAAARKELIFDAYGCSPMTLLRVKDEVFGDTVLGKRILKELGYDES